MPEWRSCTLGEVVELKRGYDLPEREREEGHFPIVSSSGVSGYHSKAMVKAPGVVTGRYGTLGLVHYITEDFWPLNTSLYVRDFKGNDPRYVSYFLRTIDFQAFSDKAAVPGLNRNHLHQAAVRVPDPDTQRAIATVLGSLDDKIEQNRRTARALERVARAIFRAWFVDFEPVKAKAAGAASFPSMPQAVFDALPSTFTDSDLGPVPEGWAVGMMGNIGVQRRKPVTPSEIDGATAYIGLEHMPRRDIALSAWGRAEDVTSSKFRFHYGDILFGKLRPYFHKVGSAPIDGVCSTDVVVLYPKASVWAAWLLMLVSSNEFVRHTDQRSAGTKMPRTNWRDMASFCIVIPPTQVAAAYEQVAQPMVAMVRQSIHESRNLAALRDYLLPRLLSGQVPVEVCEAGLVEAKGDG